MNLPQNGRIAIVDDDITQALPLINELAKKRCSFSYFSGEEKYLPIEGQIFNDIRVLFLDINLIDNGTHSDKVLKGRLVPVLKRIISTDNYPYVLIYWSRHEDEHRNIIEDIFNEDLSDRSPIDFFSCNKLDYIDLSGQKASAYDEKITELFSRIEKSLSQNAPYNNLLVWENKIHNAADQTLQDIFLSCHSPSDWIRNAKSILFQLGISYSGSKNYASSSIINKIISSYQTLNYVFLDTIEYSIRSNNDHVVHISYEDDVNDKNDASSVINAKLLTSNEIDRADSPGVIIEDLNSHSDGLFCEILNSVFNRNEVSVDLVNEESSPNNINKLASKIRGNIRSGWRKIYLVVTPLCDFVHQKNYNTRAIKGFIIDNKYRRYIDDKSEAVFISPVFKYNNNDVVIVLHLRYFFTIDSAMQDAKEFVLMRLRQQVVSEIQSKLARHISRQGILFLE